jgi:hypothetical protein
MRVLTSSNTLSAEPARAANESGRLVLEDHLARGLVLRLDNGGYGGSLALVKYFQYSAGDELKASQTTCSTNLASLTSSPLVGIGALMARNCSPWSSFA